MIVLECDIINRVDDIRKNITNYQNYYSMVNTNKHDLEILRGILFLNESTMKIYVDWIKDMQSRLQTKNDSISMKKLVVIEKYLPILESLLIELQTMD